MKSSDKAKYEALLEDAWLNIKVDPDKLFNPLDNIPTELEDKPYLYYTWLMSRPEYFYFFCKEIMNVELLPFQCVILQELWSRKFPMLIASRGASKSYLLGIYSLLRLLFIPGRKIVICGAAFRQSKIIFNYMETIWNNAPLLKDMVGTQYNGPKHEPDMYRFHIGEGMAAAIPIGTGEKIRGMRANDILSDEFSSLPREIFENVIAGFAAVKSGPVESVKGRARETMAKELGIYQHKDIDEFTDNQIIISGTAYYDFNHFGEYWKRWKQIINSRGDRKKIAEIFQSDEDGIPDNFDWTNYSIIRLPYEILPPGFMDEGMVARSRATMHAGIYDMEFGAVFSNDSSGFFKRSLIEGCVVSNENPIIINGEKVDFVPMLVGSPDKDYVFAVDPASENDNFSIVLLEINDGYRNIVHVWTITRKEHRERVKAGITQENEFYSYCARKIRELMKRFPCVHIAIDSQGGGIAVSEALHDSDKIGSGELPIWPVIDPEKPKDTDGEPGLHLLELVNFADSSWLSEANHGMRKDFEDKVLLFPRFDGGTLGIASLEDNITSRLYDNMEDCIMEIEELKNELAIIIMSQTLTGRDKWDTPEVKLPGNKKGRLRKDRYSSLLMANMAARTLLRNRTVTHSTSHGGFAVGGYLLATPNNNDFIGPAWFTERMKGVY